MDANITLHTRTDAEVLAAAYTFYHTHSVTAPFYAGDTLRLLPVERATADSWFSGEGRLLLTAWQGTRLVGMAAGAEDASRACGYLSYLCIAPDMRGRGLGQRLMDAWEAAMAARPSVRTLEVVFHNPVQLPWLLPMEGGDWHPCLPGVDIESGLYTFLQKRGWQDFVRQKAYHRRLTGYIVPPVLEETRRARLTEGLELTLYDPAQHRGLPELFDNLQNPGWKRYVLAHTDRPIPVVIDRNAAGANLVVAYTGPLSVEGTPGRGNFCGVGTHTDYRGRGLGKLVFLEMCRRHAAAGADFMSLYTGWNNPAQYMYEMAGFRNIRCFADMRKTL